MSPPVARIQAALARIPYAGFLGMGVAEAGDGGWRFMLPFKQSLIGNIWLPALHGGAIGAFLEISAQARLASEADETARLPAPIGVTVEYLRPARAVDTFADATIKRLGRRIANVHVEAWQEDPATPVTLLQGRFLLAAS